MRLYRITTASGATGVQELNDAAAAAERDRGSQLEALGLSRIAQRVQAVQEAAMLLAREDITDDQYDRAVALMRHWHIDSAELDGVVLQWAES